MNEAALQTDVAAAAKARWIDNGDGTITDTALRIMWDKYKSHPEKVSPEKAVDVCTNHRLAGHDDWRVPDRAELASTSKLDRFDPAIDQDLFPDTPSAPFWSCEEYAPDRGCFWVVDFSDGNSYVLHRYLEAFVRAVRSLPPGQ